MGGHNIYNWLRGLRGVVNGMRLGKPQIAHDGRVTLQIEFPSVELYATWIAKREEARQMLALEDRGSDPPMVA